jgi:hypothetical protein
LGTGPESYVQEPTHKARESLFLRETILGLLLRSVDERGRLTRPVRNTVSEDINIHVFTLPKTTSS